MEITSHRDLKGGVTVSAFMSYIDMMDVTITKQMLHAILEGICNQFVEEYLKDNKEHLKSLITDEMLLEALKSKVIKALEMGIKE